MWSRGKGFTSCRPGILCSFLFLCPILLLPFLPPMFFLLLAPTSSLCSFFPFFFPFFFFFFFFSGQKRNNSTDKFNISGCFVMYFLESKRGHRNGGVQMWKRSYCSLSVSGKEQHPGSQLRLLLQPTMGMALFRCVPIDGKQLTYFVRLHMWKPAICFDYTNTGRRLWREKKQINPLSLGGSWDNF